MILDLLSEVGIKVEKIGNRYRTNCIIHDEKTPSMFIFQDDHAYCFGCGTYLSPEELIERLGVKLTIDPILIKLNYHRLKMHNKSITYMKKIKIIMKIIRQKIWIIIQTLERILKIFGPNSNLETIPDNIVEIYELLNEAEYISDRLEELIWEEQTKKTYENIKELYKQVFNIEKKIDKWKPIFNNLC